MSHHGHHWENRKESAKQRPHPANLTTMTRHHESSAIDGPASKGGPDHSEHRQRGKAAPAAESTGNPPNKGTAGPRAGS